MRLTVRLLSLVALVALIAPGIPAFAAPTDACAVLSAAQVGAALGTAVGAGTYVTPGFTKTCTWVIPAGGSVTFHLETVDFFNAGKGALATAERSASSGIGEESYYLGVGPLTGLAVRKGGAAFNIHVYSKTLSVDQIKAVEVKLAQQALSQF